jgi:hypothetical protein
MLVNQRAGAWYRAACLIPVVVLVFVAGADAQQPQKTTLTLEEAIALARQNNPAFLAQQNDLGGSEWGVRPGYGE